MSVRRFSLAAALALAVAVTAAYAAPQVTVVLTNGQQYTGALAAQNNGNNIALVAPNGQRMSWSSRSVAVIEFTPGQPSSEELQQVANLPGNQTVLSRVLSTSNVAAVLQDGQIISGRLVAISNDGNQITLVTANNQRDNYLASDIARLYLNPSAAQNALAMNQQSQPGAVGTTGTLGQPTSVTIPANQAWTDTGIYVRRGERIQFNASGQIRWSPDFPRVGPEGGGSTPGAPMSAPGGALIGRVGNSAPFVVANGQIVTAPADGELMLGINDDNVSDNTGNFQVQIAHSGGH
jgi:small nuclear ribonucleoprotein (snRNP)-like protein